MSAHEVPASIRRRWEERGLAPSTPLVQALDAAVASTAAARLQVDSRVMPADLSLTELRAAALCVAAGLRALGVLPGEVVALQLPNWAESWIGYTAALLAGAIVLPLLPLYGEAELAFALTDARVKVLLTPARLRSVDFRERIARLAGLPASFRHVVVERAAPEGRTSWTGLELEGGFAPHVAAPDDVALLVYTSGTAGAPKGVQHSHRSLLAELACNRGPVRWEGRRVLSPWPPGHVAGFLAYLRFATAGLDTILMDAWDPGRAAQLIAERAVTSSSGTPFHLQGLLDAAGERSLSLASLTDFMVGAATVQAELIARCEAAGIRTYRSYGSSEHPTISNGDRTDPLGKRQHTDGLVSAGTEIRIVDDADTPLPIGAEGEILTRGPEQFVGYLDARLDEGVILPGGWYRTGDIGRLDADGYLTITDRKKDLVIRAGENISSREVEGYLLRMPGVVDAAVVGMRDERHGEKVCAFVVLDEEATLDVETIAAFIAGLGVSRHKAPEELRRVDELPRNSAGKVLKPRLRELLTKSRPHGS